MSTFIARMAVLLMAIALVSTAVARAQTTNTQSSPAPQPTSSAPPSPSQRTQITSNDGHGPEIFVAGDYLFSPNSANEFNPSGAHGVSSFAGRAAIEFPFKGFAVMAEGLYDQYQYTTQAGFVPTIGNKGHTFVPAFYAHTSDWEGRVGVGIPYPRVYVVGSFAQRINNYGYPAVQGFGFGIEKLPDFNRRVWSFYGSYLWYPQLGSGAYLQYGFYKYNFGVEFHAPRIPVFLDTGWMGDYGYNKLNAPTNINDHALYAGLGFWI
jgi:hypothetical protein